MDNCYCVYIHTCKIDGKRYVGLTRRKPEDRWGNGNNYKNSTHFRRAIEKYGWDNFDHEIYATNLTAEEASELEKELIAKYKTTDDRYGYNLDSGGSYTKHSEITKDRIRQKIKGIKRSPETIEKMRKNAKGNKYSVGRKHTEESKQKNREAHLGKTHVLTEEGKYNIMMGHKNRKEVICVELGITYPSIDYAAKQMNGNQGTISGALLGRTKTAYGYHWKYKQ